jgi:hypothetical protein
MLKMLLLPALAATLSATTVSSQCPAFGFSIGHVNISNCQTSITYTIPNDGSFTRLDLDPFGVSGSIVEIRETGSATLASGGLRQQHARSIWQSMTSHLRALTCGSTEICGVDCRITEIERPRAFHGDWSKSTPNSFCISREEPRSYINTHARSDALLLSAWRLPSEAKRQLFEHEARPHRVSPLPTGIPTRDSPTPLPQTPQGDASSLHKQGRMARWDYRSTPIPG